MDSLFFTIRFFDRLIRCYVEPFQGDCAEIGTIFDKVFSGIKYPYCDLQEAEKEARMTEIEKGLAHGSSSTNGASVLMLMLAFLIAMCDRC